MRILVVEKNPMLSRQISEALVCEGFRVDSFLVLDEVYSAISIVKAYLLVILDTGIDDDSSLKVIKKIRSQTPKTTILAMIEEDCLQNRIKILDAGADKVMVKPFLLTELVAHCRALLRRVSSSTQEVLLKAGNVTLNARTSEVVIDRKRVRVTKREVNLLTQSYCA